MQLLDSTERYCVCETFTTNSSRRFILFSYQIESERYIYVQYIRTLLTQRKLGYSAGYITSDRKLFTPERWDTLASHRFMAAGWGNPPSGDRYCTYTPGAQVLLLATPVHFPIRIPCDIWTLCSTNPISQRQIMYSYTGISEKIIDFAVVQQINVNTPEVYFPVTHRNEMICLVQTLNTMSQRVVIFPLQVVCEVTTLVQRFRKINIFTSLTNFGVLDIHSEVWCECVSMATITERQCFMMGNPHSDRYLTFNVNMATERSICLIVHKMRYVYEFKVIQAVPIPTERWCYYLPIIYYIERLTIVETRPLFVKKTPNAIRTEMVLFSDADEEPQMSITNQRTIELSGTTITKLQQESGINVNRAVFSSKQNVFSISSVDNTGASVSKSNTNKERKLLESVIDCLDITFNNT